MKVDLTKKELYVLMELLWCNPCKSGCCYGENETKNIDCDRCEFTIARASLREKIEKLNM